MALFTIATTPFANAAPSAVGSQTIEIAHGATHVFTLANFTTETIPPYADPEGDAVSKVRIETILETNGQLFLSAVAVVATDEIDVADIVAGNLTWVDDSTNALAHTANFTFKISDVGSSIFSTDIGTMGIGVLAEANLPPTAVGDRSETVNYAAQLVFTSAMFTTLTTPAYSDPESDAADLLKITGLPTLGVIELNGVPVVLNQIITFVDIAAGNLTFSGDLADLSPVNSTFNFAIADAGSGIFVS